MNRLASQRYREGAIVQLMGRLNMARAEAERIIDARMTWWHAAATSLPPATTRRGRS